MTETSEKRPGCAARLARGSVRAVLSLLLVLWVAWAGGALHYDLPDSWPSGLVVTAFFVAVAAALIFVKGGWRGKAGAVAVLCAVVNVWWVTIEASRAADFPSINPK